MPSYRINTPYIVSEVFVDDEAAIINLKTGNYYSLNKTATEIWSQIEKGAALTEITNFISDNFDVQDPFFGTEVTRFVEKLVDEGLIVAEETNGSTRNGGTRNSAADTKSKKVYETPVLECYADMQELLLLDPIHEVEETNWLVNKPQ
jgi:hypothetical protein